MVPVISVGTVPPKIQGSLLVTHRKVTAYLLPNSESGTLTPAIQLSQMSDWVRCDIFTSVIVYNIKQYC